MEPKTSHKGKGDNMKHISTVEWKWNDNYNGITLTFINCVTGMVDVRTYKTAAAAKAAETKFHNRMCRTYGNVSRPATDSYYPYM